jgi:hypothetical protein
MPPSRERLGTGLWATADQAIVAQTVPPMVPIGRIAAAVTESSRAAAHHCPQGSSGRSGSMRS